MKKKIFSIIIILILFIVVNLILTPKYVIEYKEGSLIKEYYDEQVKHDVIFIGDCETYANFSPIELYEEYGISSYIRGTPQQMIWQTYSILKETLKYEIPKVVIINVNSMRYSETVSEAYNHLTIDNMKWSKEKIEIIKSSITDDESFLDYLVPVYRYHERIFDLKKEDFVYLFNKKTVGHNGFLLNLGVKGVGTMPSIKALSDYSFSDRNWEYLDKIRMLCEDNYIKLVLIKAPSLYPVWYEEYDDNIREYASTNGLDYYNLYELKDEIGIDYDNDTYDAGLHLNYYGAKKLSSYFGNILLKYELNDYRKNESVDRIYQDKILKYCSELQELKNEKNN